MDEEIPDWNKNLTLEYRLNIWRKCYERIILAKAVNIYSLSIFHRVV